MARFRSTPTGSVGTFAGSRDVGIPTPMQMKSAGVTTNAGSAAGAVSVGSIYGGLRDSAPKYDSIAATAEKLAAEERIAAEAAAANTEIAGINAKATIKGAKLQASAMKKQASASKTGSIFGAIGSIAGAAIGLSDETTKHTVDRIDNALETLRNLKPVTFYYKEEFSSSPERLHYGFIAQEYEKVMPDATYYDETIGKLCIDTTELISLLVRANQQLEARVSRMEAKQVLEAV